MHLSNGIPLEGQVTGSEMNVKISSSALDTRVGKSVMEDDSVAQEHLKQKRFKSSFKNNGHKFSKGRIHGRGGRR